MLVPLDSDWPEYPYNYTTYFTSVSTSTIDDEVDEGNVGPVGALPILGENWWALAMRGGFAIVLGVLAAIWPNLTPQLLAVLFASYLLVDAIFAVITAIAGAEDRRRWWPMLAESLIGIAVAFWIFLTPGMAIDELSTVIGFWAILTGSLEIYAGQLLRRFIEDSEWWLTTAGIVSLVFGIALIWLSGFERQTLIWLLVGYALFFGMAFIALAFQVRTVQRRSLAAPPV